MGLCFGFPVHPTPLELGLNLKGKDFLSKEQILFRQFRSHRVDSKNLVYLGGNNIFNSCLPWKCVHFHLKSHSD